MFQCRDIIAMLAIAMESGRQQKPLIEHRTKNETKCQPTTEMKRDQIPRKLTTISCCRVCVVLVGAVGGSGALVVIVVNIRFDLVTVSRRVIVLYRIQRETGNWVKSFRKESVGLVGYTRVKKRNLNSQH